MSLQTNITNALTALAGAVKTNRVNLGSLSSLTTSAKTDVVSAVNEVKAAIANAGAQIDDTTASTSKVYSSSKTTSVVTAAVAAVVNGAPAAFDTLKEISDQLAADETGTATMFANRLRVDAAQSLTTAQQTQGQANLAVYSTAQIGDVTHDFVADVNAALT